MFRPAICTCLIMYSGSVYRQVRDGCVRRTAIRSPILLYSSYLHFSECEPCQLWLIFASFSSGCWDREDGPMMSNVQCNHAVLGYQSHELGIEYIECPSLSLLCHELVRAKVPFGCFCDSFGCYPFLSPVYPTLVPPRSLDQIVRGSCCGNTSPLLLLVTLWECYLSFNCCNWHFVWVPSCFTSKCSESNSFDAFKSWAIQLAGSTPTPEFMIFGQGHSNHHQGGLHKLYVRADVWLSEFPKDQYELSWLPCMCRWYIFSVFLRNPYLAVDPCAGHKSWQITSMFTPRDQRCFKM